MTTRAIGGGSILVQFKGTDDIMDHAEKLDQELRTQFNQNAGLLRRLSLPGRPIDVRHGNRVRISYGQFVERHEVLDLAKTIGFELPPDQNDRVVQPAMVTAN